MNHHPQAVLTAGAMLAAATIVACSSTTTSSTDTAAPATTAPAPACPPTSLAVTAVDGTKTTVTGPTAVADLLVRNGHTGNFNFANYAIPNDQAYGVASAGNLTQGQVLVSLALTPTTGRVEAGTYTSDDTGGTATTVAASSVGTVSYFAVLTGAGTQSPVAKHQVVLTSVTAQQVCGTITPEGSTADTASVTGSFTTNRIYSGQAAAAGSVGGGTTGTTTAGTSSSSSSSTSTSSTSTSSSSTSSSTSSSSTVPSGSIGA